MVSHLPETPPSVPGKDVLVFRWTAPTFHLIGGAGRGAGWADVVDVAQGDSPWLDSAWRSGAPVRSSSDVPIRVAGPYWAAKAVFVAVGHEHVVVFGGPEMHDRPDIALVTAAARAVAETGETSAEKLLSDELEVAHAVRALTACQPTSVQAVARHVAKVAATALSCDVAAVRVRDPHNPTLEIMLRHDVDGMEPDATHAGRDAAHFLDTAATASEPIVEQTVGPDPEIWTDSIVSRMTIAIGPESGLGALSLGHAYGRERGFTSLCQRIGRALAESAEPLLAQAIEREQLTAERAAYKRASQTDQLTGMGTRSAWDSALVATASALRARDVDGYGVLSVDVDDLKLVNDKWGHAAGDSLLQLVASIVRSSLRATDVLCRVGGDEFLCLLPDALEADMLEIADRVAEAMARAEVIDCGVEPSVSIGWAIYDGDWAATVRTADERMYAIKRRKATDAKVGDVGEAPDSQPEIRPQGRRNSRVAA
jgi:diguanylate cyclase (GGDEF)-like protein